MTAGASDLRRASTQPDTRVVPVDEITPAILGTLRAHLLEKTGLRVDDERVAGLRESMLARMGALGLDSFAAYCGRLVADDGAGELDALVSEFTVGETYFFRVPRFFASLAEQILPEVLAAKRATGDHCLRIWSGACATGEEPYSIAMCLVNAGLDLEEWHVEILATDVCNRSLERARRGVYSRWAFRGVDDDDALVWRFFERTGRHFRIGPQPRQMVTLESFNLATEPFPLPRSGPSWDLVFLRNVLMYLDPAVVARVVANTQRALADGGFLFIGECETMPGLARVFEARELAGIYHYRKRERGRPGATEPSTRTAVSTRPAPSPRVARRAQAARVSRPGSSPTSSAEVRAAPAERAARLYEIAMTQIEAEQFSEAIAALQTALGFDPHHRGARLALANVYVHWGSFAEARALCVELLAEDALRADAHLLLGVARFHEADYEGALDSLRRALYLEPSSVVGHFFAGEAHDRLGRPELARKDYERALAAARNADVCGPELGFERRTLVGAVEQRLAGRGSDGAISAAASEERE